MKFYSEYLKKELDFVTNVQADDVTGEPVHIIPHESLLTLAKQENLNIKKDVIYASQHEAVLSCTISDGNGKSVEWIGESNPLTADGNEVKKRFRFTMAFNQAFDRAMIIFLQLPDKRIKSDAEMSPTGSEERQPGPQKKKESVNEEGKKMTPEEVVQKYGAYVIKLGKYSTGRTLAEIHDTDLKWLTWVCSDQFTSHTEEQKKQLAVAGLYLEARGMLNK